MVRKWEVRERLMGIGVFAWGTILGEHGRVGRGRTGFVRDDTGFGDCGGAVGTPIDKGRRCGVGPRVGAYGRKKVREICAASISRT